MARAIGKLSARAAATAKPGRHGDGGGLWLAVAPTGARKWVFRFSHGGRVTEMGLGNASVSLADARAKAAECRKLLAGGLSPIEARRKASEGKPSFGECADALIASKESQWRNAKHRAQWRMTLETYAAPLRELSVAEIGTEHVLAVLKPIWQTKPETASRLRGRIEAVLDYAKAHSWRAGENPAAWRGHLQLILPKRQALSRGHHGAMPFAEVPAFMAALRERPAIAARALEFTILAAARSGEALGARWDEIDFQSKTWTIPAGRMKAGKAHRVPLSGAAMAIIEGLAEARTGEFVFPGQRRDRPLSNMAMEMVLRRMKLDGVTVHGFRSAFRDWAGDRTSFPRELAEAALAHGSGNKVEAAYRRSDALEKRRALMEAWEAYLEAGADSKVVRLVS